MGTEEGSLLVLRLAKCIIEDAPLEAATEADQGKAREIAMQLGGLPLALDQAGAYIEETSYGLSDYLELYRNHAPELLRRRGMLPFDYPESVATTWALSFEKIEYPHSLGRQLYVRPLCANPCGVLCARCLSVPRCLSGVDPLENSAFHSK
jgi:hypothetical protein